MIIDQKMDLTSMLLFTLNTHSLAYKTTSLQS